MTRDEAQRWLDNEPIHFVFQYTNPVDTSEYRILYLTTTTSQCKRLMDDMRAAGINIDEVYPDYSEDGSEKFLGWEIDEVLNAEAENEANRKAVDTYADRMRRALRKPDQS